MTNYILINLTTYWINGLSLIHYSTYLRLRPGQTIVQCIQNKIIFSPKITAIKIWWVYFCSNSRKQTKSNNSEEMYLNLRMSKKNMQNEQQLYTHNIKYGMKTHIKKRNQFLPLRHAESFAIASENIATPSISRICKIIFLEYHFCALMRAITCYHAKIVVYHAGSFRDYVFYL